MQWLHMARLADQTIWALTSHVPFPLPHRCGRSKIPATSDCAWVCCAAFELQSYV
jgi:hypothetical protein